MAVGFAVGAVPVAESETSTTGGVVVELGTAATGGVGAVGVLAVMVGEVITMAVLGGAAGANTVTK